MAVVVGQWNLDPAPAVETQATQAPGSAAPRPAAPEKVQRSLRELAARSSRVRAH